MPVNVRNEVQRLKGLPSDDDIRGWIQKLRLCIQEIEADIDYDTYNSLRDDGEDVNEYVESLMNEMSAPYLAAIIALNDLLPPDENL